ncbi:MAG: DUF1131 family protein [Enterobacteriaceae bacterium]
MNFVRGVLLAIPLLVTGCSTSWLNMLPFMGSDSGDLQISANGLGPIGAQSSMNKAKLQQALDNHYPLQEGVGIYHNKIQQFFQSLDKDNNVLLTLYGQSGGTVQGIEVQDPRIATAWDVKLGTLFSKIYQKAFDVCQKGEDDNSVICRSPQSPQVSYRFTGEWSGPTELMPPDNILAQWKVSAIIWQAK